MKIAGIIKEKDIRSDEAYDAFIQMVMCEAERLSKELELKPTSCPACKENEEKESFVKWGFRHIMCKKCETLYVSPRPSPEDLSEIYKSSEATEYFAKKFLEPVMKKRKRLIFRPRAKRLMERILKIRDNLVVCDIGAGHGLFLEELRDVCPGLEYWAIEPSIEMAKICRDKGFNVIENVFEETVGDENVYDVVTCFELFEHLQDPEAFVSSVREKLKPNGYFYFTTLSADGLDIRALWEESKAVCPPRHLNFFNPKSIEMLLKRKGFGYVEVSTPGVLDWEIIEKNIKKIKNHNRIFDLISKQNSECKASLQKWISENRLSSHMEILAKR